MCYVESSEAIESNQVTSCGRDVLEKIITSWISMKFATFYRT
jgi:hypothetical protein